jgi:hypothetical protein
MPISASTIREIIASAEAGWTVPEIEANVNGYDEFRIEFDIDGDFDIDIEEKPESAKLLPGGVCCNFYNALGEPDNDQADLSRVGLFSL